MKRKRSSGPSTRAGTRIDVTTVRTRLPPSPWRPPQGIASIFPFAYRDHDGEGFARSCAGPSHPSGCRAQVPFRVGRAPGGALPRNSGAARVRIGQDAPSARTRPRGDALPGQGVGAPLRHSVGKTISYASWRRRSEGRRPRAPWRRGRSEPRSDSRAVPPGDRREWIAHRIRSGASDEEGAPVARGRKEA